MSRPRKPKPESPSVPKIVFAISEFVPRGDGSFIIHPRLIDDDAWISPKEAAKMIGFEDARQIYNIIDESAPMLVHRRPAKTKCLISLRSVRAFIATTADPEFWDSQVKMKAFIATVRRQLATLRTVL